MWTILKQGAREFKKKIKEKPKIDHNVTVCVFDLRLNKFVNIGEDNKKEALEVKNRFGFSEKLFSFINLYNGSINIAQL